MKRQVGCIALMVVAGCGGGSAGSAPSGQSPNASPSATAAAAVAPVDPPHRQNLIVMTENDGHDSTVTADCAAVVTLYSLKAQRGHKIRWNIQNDLFNECPDLDENKLELRFEEDKGALAENNSSTSDVLEEVKAKKRKVEGFVHVLAAKVPNGKYKYTVFYDGKPASPDPQLDISGDCGCILPEPK